MHGNLEGLDPKEADVVVEPPLGSRPKWHTIATTYSRKEPM